MGGQLSAPALASSGIVTEVRVCSRGRGAEVGNDLDLARDLAGVPRWSTAEMEA